jgi:hypothetical protein
MLDGNAARRVPANTSGVQVGTVLMGDESMHIRDGLALESKPYLPNWSVVQALDSFALDRKVRAAGWNFFFLAAEIKVSFFGAMNPESIQRALRRILARAGKEHFNCLEVTGLVAKRFLGVPYATVSAHSRHIQRSCHLRSIESRQNRQLDEHWT